MKNEKKISPKCWGRYYKNDLEWTTVQIVEYQHKNLDDYHLYYWCCSSKWNVCRRRTIFKALVDLSIGLTFFRFLKFRKANYYMARIIFLWKTFKNEISPLTFRLRAAVSSLISLFTNVYSKIQFRAAYEQNLGNLLVTFEQRFLRRLLKGPSVLCYHLKSNKEILALNLLTVKVQIFWEGHKIWKVHHFV